MTAPEPRFWINTVSLDHVEEAARGGFTQADHGMNSRLHRLTSGDSLVFYSPRTALTGGTPVQQFTALGVVTGSAPYQVVVTDDFRPWRLTVEFAQTHWAPAKPLVPRLGFVADKTHWGLPFRRGLFTIPEADFAIIAAAMTAA
jgi:hypothetical protein